MNIHFVTFATSNWIEYKKRYNDQITYIQDNYQLFDTVSILDENDLDINYYKQIEKILDKKREFYQMSWKPYIIFKLLNKIRYGDCVLYMDGGCSFINYREFNSEIKELFRITNSLNENNFISMNFYDGKKLPVKIQIRLKMLDVFQLKNDSKFLCTFPHYQTNAILVYKCTASMKLMSDWFNFYLKYPEILNVDRIDKTGEMEYFFQDNRDQSIMHCLLYKNGINVIPYQSSLKFTTRIRR